MSRDNSPYSGDMEGMPVVESGVAFLEITLINLVLSGDNALVIAMASRRLPERLRRKAVWWGTFGAIALRIALTFVAVLLLKLPLLQTAGGLLLMVIAVKLLMGEGHGDVQSAATVAGAVQTILLADLVMSLDNVLAVAALSRGDPILLASGIALSIPLILWGSSFIVRLLNRFPALTLIGAAILGYAAGEMFLADRLAGPWLSGLPGRTERLVPLVAASFVLLWGLVSLLLKRTDADRRGDGK